MRYSCNLFPAELPLDRFILWAAMRAKIIQYIAWHTDAVAIAAHPATESKQGCTPSPVAHHLNRDAMSRGAGQKLATWQLQSVPAGA